MFAIVTGKVQGVGFRRFVKETAQGLDIRGWVKNLPDGSVSLEAEGEKDDILAFLQALKERQPLATISSIDHRIMPISHSSFSDFIIKH